MIWQLAVFLESFHGKLPDGWETIVVICNDGKRVSPSLSHVLSTYHVRHFCSVNYPRRENIDFISGRKVYASLNKITALEVVAAHVKASDIVCLLDTDMFLYGDLNTKIFPAGNALCDNWLINKPLFFSDLYLNEGIDLQKLLDSIGCRRRFQGGGVIIFLKGETVRNRAFVRDCFRFSQVLYLLGKIMRVHGIWIAEMPAYALALTAHEIDYEVLKCAEFSVENTKDQTIPRGSLYHYYAVGAFWGSPWLKGHFRNRDLLRANLARFERLAQSNHEKCFFALAKKARARLGSGPGPSTGSRERPVFRQGRRAWLRERILDPLRYLRYHTLKAMDPEAATHRDLKLPRMVSLLYKRLLPVRRWKKRVRGRRDRILRRKQSKQQ